MTMIDTRTVQRFLAGKARYAGAFDGKESADLEVASRAYLYSLTPAQTSFRHSWAAPRVRTAIEQAIFESIGHELGVLDGVTGPRTQVALERWQDAVAFQTPSVAAPVSIKTGPSSAWPRQSEAEAFYGAPGANLVRITPPYPVFYGGARVGSILINKRCADSARRIMDRVLAVMGAKRIAELGLDQFGGCYNNRPMRNGTTLSTHAFAAAWDWNPTHNQLRWTAAQAHMARPECAAFIDAHEAEGWVSMGRARGYDFMHFQAVRLG